MSMRMKFSVAADIVYDYGWGTLLGTAVPWLLNRRYVAYAGPISPSNDDPQTAVPFRLDRVTSGDIGHLLRLRPAFYDRKLVADRLAQGHLCFLGWSGEAAVYIHWIFTRPVFLPYLGKTLDLAPGETYSDEVYTVREFRRRSIYLQGWRLMGLQLSDLGFRRCLVLFASWNVNPMKKMEELGLKRVGECGLRGFFLPGQFYASGSIIEEDGDRFRVLADKDPA